jgi:hypothetical protein
MATPALSAPTERQGSCDTEPSEASFRSVRPSKLSSRCRSARSGGVAYQNIKAWSRVE